MFSDLSRTESHNCEAGVSHFDNDIFSHGSCL